MRKQLITAALIGGICFSGAPGFITLENSVCAYQLIASLRSISLPKDIIAIDESVQLKLEWSNGALPEVSYSSSDESIAAVDQDGVVTGIGDGTAVITLSIAKSTPGEYNTKTIEVPVSGSVRKSIHYNNSELTAGTKLYKYDTLHYDGKTGMCANIVNAKGDYDYISMSQEDYTLPYDAEVIDASTLILYIAPEIEGVTYIDGRTLEAGTVIDRNSHLLCYDYQIDHYIFPVFLPSYYDKYIGEGEIRVKGIDRDKKIISLEAVKEDNTQKTGDINGDGTLSVSDLVELQKYFFGVPDNDEPSSCDLNEDGKVNILDICLMKKKLMDAADALS